MRFVKQALPVPPRSGELEGETAIPRPSHPMTSGANAPLPDGRARVGELRRVTESFDDDGT